MADAALIGASASNYTGDPNLGGGSFGFGRIDTRPLDDLARYTFLYNKAEYDQRQKDAERAADEIAAATSYDLTSPIQKDAKLLQEKYDALVSFMKTNPNAINYRDKEAWATYKRMRNDLDNDLKGAKVRGLMYQARQKEIADATAPELKSYLQKNLDNEVASTDIRTPIKLTSKYDISPVDVPAAPMREVQTTDIGRNFVGQATFTLPDMSLLGNIATTLSTGLDKLTDFENQDWFKALPEDRKQQYREQFLAQQASGKLEPVESANNINKALANLPPQFYTTDAAGHKTIDVQQLQGYDNGIVRGVAEQTELYNKQMAYLRNGIKNGWFKDHFGNELHFGNDVSGLKESDFRDINLNDGFSPEELVKLRMLGKAPSPNRTIKIIPTDNELEARRIAAEWGRIGVDRDRLNMANSQSIIGADAVVREVADAINSAPYGTISGGGERDRIIREIADPNILKEFGTIDKDGNMINRPDRVFFEPKSNQLSIIYYKKVPDAKTGQPTGEIAVDKRGKPIVDREVPMNPTQWFGQIVNRKFSTGDAGPVNNFVDQIYGQFDRDLTKLAERYRGGATTSGPKSGTRISVSSSTSQPAIPTGTRDEWKANGWNDAQINQAVKDGKIKVIQ